MNAQSGFVSASLDWAGPFVGNFVFGNLCYPLHIGAWGGRFSKVLTVLMGLSPLVFSISGFLDVAQLRAQNKQTMKKLLIYGALLAPLSISAPALAQQKALVATAKGATKTLFAQGFKEAQGLAMNLDGHIAVADALAGEVVLLDKNGARLKTLASGLKTPTMLIPDGCSGFLVAERGANRVIALKEGGKIFPYLAEVEEPIGLWSRDDYMVRVVSHTTSQIFEWTGSDGVDDKNQIPGAWKLIYKPSDEDGGATRYGLRCLVGAGDSLFFSDQTDGVVWMMASNGFIAPLAKGLGDPSGLAFSPDGALFVADESEGGRLWRVERSGKAQIVAGELGRPRGLLFLDAKTVLVASRDGKIWRVAL